jgi:asparagine synthase (glutamine-hydrolysing)
MCGISAIVTDQPRTPDQIRASVRRMGLWQHHRGPDDWGEWITPQVGLGHNRLAIIDVEKGQQPMASPDEAVRVVYNGEIYNYRDLWRELQSKGHTFRTDHSDTEVIVNGYLEWGSDVFSRLHGMFAVALWDERARALVVARDRSGIKPLYLAELPGGGLVVASEPKAIVGSGVLDCPFRPEGLPEYFLFRAPRGPHTLWRNVFKIQPGHFATYRPGRGLGAQRPYWVPTEQPVVTASPAQADQELESRLSMSVEGHLISDVPVGVFLSGGVDSSAVAALAAPISRLSAFTIGTDSVLDETPFAARVARHLDLPFHDRRVSSEDFLGRLEDWAHVNDDPSADPSALALMLLSEHARDHGYKVMLGGEGADELFGGYNAYVRFLFFWRLAQVPLAGRIGPALSGWVNGRERDYLRTLRRPRFFGTGHLTDRRLLESLLTEDLAGSIIRMYGSDLGVVDHPERPARAAMRFDQVTRLPDDLLMRTDRASMFFSLETRVPYLGTEVVEWANRLDDRSCLRLRGGDTKRPLKRLAARLVPADVVYRKKRGFDLPLREWLLSDPHFAAEDLLLERAVPGLSSDPTSSDPPRRFGPG